MAVSLDRSSPSQLNKNLGISMGSSTPLISPSSEKQIWSTLRSRVDTLLENRQLKEKTGWVLIPDQNLPPKAPSVREDCLLLLRGFDSMSSSLSQLRENLDTALQGATDLSKTSLTELLHNDSEKLEAETQEEEEEGNNVKAKRKHESHQSSDDQGDLEYKENEQSPNNGKLKKAKKLAISMATNAASLSRELKSIKSDLSFMQERCTLLEEENRRLREGSEKGLRPEEDDLVRLQLEALLAEKSRLANENANLVRENQCLHQLVEYHQLTSSQDDISESYEQVVRGMCLDFSSPTERDSNNGEIEGPLTPRTDIFGFSNCLDQYYEE